MKKEKQNFRKGNLVKAVPVIDPWDHPIRGFYHLTEEEHEWMERMTKIMLTSLDGYRSWPIDSSDL